MKSAFLLNIPVLHKGYLNLFQRYPNVKNLYLIGERLQDKLRPDYSSKEIRAMPSEQTVKMLGVLELFDSIQILTDRNIKDLKETEIVTSNERISHKLIETHYPKNKVTYDTTFLRWDEDKVLSIHDINFNSETTDSFDREIIKRISGQAQASSDWWRQVGAAIVKDGKVILESHNQHLPTQDSPYINGDPRDFVQAGTNSHLSSAIHAEQSLIAEAARRGTSIDGTSIYVTVFPCPVCAKIIACSGIRKCYFATGHASLDGEEVLKSFGVEIIKISLSQ